MLRFQTVLSGLLLACGFSLFLNAADLQHFMRGELTVAHLGAHLGSPDETYYFALIREVRDGFWTMGNSSLLEHRTAPSITGYALLPQGLLAATGLDLPTVILIGDLFFPAAIGFLVFLIALRLFHRQPEALLFSFAFLARWNFGLLRTMNPQVTMFVFFLGLFLFVSDRSNHHPWWRGTTLAALVFVQPIFAVLMIALEGIDALIAFADRHSLTAVIRDRFPVFLLPILAGLIQSTFVTLHTDADILADLSARRGLILSHLPSYPSMSFFLLMLGILWFLRLRRTQYRDERARVMVMFACAGILVLNQQILHGHEAIFRLYYHVPLTAFLFFMTFLFLELWVPRRILLTALLIVSMWYGSRLIPAVHAFTNDRTASIEAFRSSGVSDVLDALAALPGERVVFAPIEVSNFVPILTDDYTLLTQYAHYEYASDRELAERYLLIRRFFPLPPSQTITGDPLVFGLAAGNLYARAKTVCRLFNRMHLSARDCEARSLPDFIRHQDVRRFVDAGVIDAETLLLKYQVDTVIAAQPLPEPLASHCYQSGSGGPYTIYDCRFGR